MLLIEVNSTVQKRNRFFIFSPMPFFVAGTVDGINPLALATVVIFTLILLFLRRSRREVLVAGIIFIGTVWMINYLAKNYFFDELFDTDIFYYIAQGTYLLLGLAALAAGAVSLYDWWKIRQTGEIKDILFKLPSRSTSDPGETTDPVSQSKTKKILPRWLFVIVFSFFVALFLSLIQSVYPSPPYLQGLVDIYLFRHFNGLREELVLYLMLYSFMSVLPLILVLIFVLKGFFSPRFSAFLKSWMRTTKMVVSALFFAMGVGLLYQLDKSIFGG